MKPSEPKSAAKILHDARWMACLSQAQVAHRAGLTQQTVAKYERGVREPSVGTLRRLIAGCGYELVLGLMPAPGLEDWATLKLLERPPLERLGPDLAPALGRLVRTLRGIDMVVGGKTAARLRGADVRVFEVELWVSETIDVDTLNECLDRAEVIYVSGLGQKSPAEVTREQLLHGQPLVAPGADVRLRSIPYFNSVRDRASVVVIPDEPHSFLLASPDDCPKFWHDRDLDRLELQRAVRLASSS